MEGVVLELGMAAEDCEDVVSIVADGVDEEMKMAEPVQMFLFDSIDMLNGLIPRLNDQCALTYSYVAIVAHYRGAETVVCVEQAGMSGFILATVRELRTCNDGIANLCLVLRSVALESVRWRGKEGRRA